MYEESEQVFDKADDITFAAINVNSCYQRNEIRYESGEKLVGRRDTISDTSLIRDAKENRVDTVVTFGDISIQESTLNAKDFERYYDLRIVLGRGLMTAAGHMLDVVLMGEIDNQADTKPTVFQRPAVEQDKQTVHVSMITEKMITERSDRIVNEMNNMGFEKITDEKWQLELLDLLRKSLIDAASKIGVGL